MFGTGRLYIRVRGQNDFHEYVRARKRGGELKTEIFVKGTGGAQALTHHCAWKMP